VASEPTTAGTLRIGRYEVISHLATGGMAQIYLARQTGLGSFERHVVLKTILRERATDQRFVTMFLDEAKLAATLNHQNVAQVYEVDHADGAYFMAMEYVHGENTRAILETTIRRGWTIPLELAVMIISGAAAGLHHAHERRGKNGQPLQIVHRDVSPANIMVGYDGSVKVLDFGIAKAEERATKTIGGTIKGKYGYMSPEQCKGRPIDRRSDIFALGIVLYELATLRRAFKGNDDFETMKRIVAGDLVLPSTLVAGFPRELEAIILTALATDSGARFQTAQELIEALDAFTVRAKLTGSNTAMGRFMVQLFGTKKEPWIDATLQSTDHTLVTPAELEDYEDDNDETLVVGHREDVQRALAELNIGVAAALRHGPPAAARRGPAGRLAARCAAAAVADARARPAPQHPAQRRAAGPAVRQLAAARRARSRPAVRGVRCTAVRGRRPGEPSVQSQPRDDRDRPRADHAGRAGRTHRRFGRGTGRDSLGADLAVDDGAGTAHAGAAGHHAPGDDAADPGADARWLRRIDVGAVRARADAGDPAEQRAEHPGRAERPAGAGHRRHQLRRRQAARHRSQARLEHVGQSAVGDRRNLHAPRERTGPDRLPDPVEHALGRSRHPALARRDRDDHPHHLDLTREAQRT
jgi:eukaryotic-like serine/threonine-protein kinase